MSEERWSVTVEVHRQKGQQAPHLDRFAMEVDPDEYVLEVIERIWAFRDRSLTFQHACHHSTCGACGMRVNGAEKLTCITPVRAVVQNGGAFKVEPLRNFPVVSDLVVDLRLLYARMQQVGYEPVTPADHAPLPLARDTGVTPERKMGVVSAALRLNDCIECGLCISACPISTTNPAYLGPAILAAIQYEGLADRPELAAMADHEDGVWRCHSAYECTAVCPSFVNPGQRIMELRRKVVGGRIKRLFKGGRE